MEAVTGDEDEFDVICSGFEQIDDGRRRRMSRRDSEE